MNNRIVSKGFVGASIGLWLGLIGYCAFGAEKAPVCPKGFAPLATCNNGLVQCSATGEHRGACSGAGGVKAWADGSPVRSRKPKQAWAK